MALKAGYVGIKNRLMLSLQDKLLKLDNIIPAGASSDNPLATEQEIGDIWAANNILGAKNLLSSKPTNIHTANGTINANGSITLSGAISNDIVVQFSARGNADAMILSKDVSYILSIKNAIEKVALQVGYTDPDTGNYVQLAQSGMGESSLSFTSPVDTVKWTMQLVKHSSVTTIEEVTIYPMLRLAEDPNNAYVPFAMTNQQLTQDKMSITGVLTNANDLDNVREAGVYTATSTPTHTPEGRSYFIMLVTGSASNVKQLIMTSGNNMYLRSYGGSPAAWSNWYKYTGTEIVPASITAIDPETREASEEEPVVTTKSTRKSSK